MPILHQNPEASSPFSIQNNDILKWWENRQHSPNQPFPEQPQILDPVMYSNPIRKVNQPTPFVQHNINQVPDWWNHSRQHSPNEPYPIAVPVIDHSMYSTLMNPIQSPQNQVNPVSFIEGNSTSFLKRSYSTAFEADSSVVFSHSNARGARGTMSKIGRYEKILAHQILEQIQVLSDKVADIQESLVRVKGMVETFFSASPTNSTQNVETSLPFEARPSQSTETIPEVIKGSKIDKGKGKEVLNCSTNEDSIINEPTNSNMYNQDSIDIVQQQNLYIKYSSAGLLQPQ